MSKDELKSLFLPFMGKQTQIPPKYSALKYEGESLYRLIREKLVTEEEMNKILEEKKREIEIYDIEVLEINVNKDTLKLKVSCSSGTYIRTLVEDIAKISFNTVATVKNLHRINVGDFKVEDAYTINKIIESENNIKNDNDKGRQYVLDIEDVFFKFPKTRIEEQRVYYFKNGVRITNKISDGLYRVYSFNKEENKDEIKDKFIGLGLVEKGLMKREYIYED